MSGFAKTEQVKPAVSITKKNKQLSRFGCSFQRGSESQRIEAERDERIRKRFGEMVRQLSLTQGSSKVTRDIYPVFEAQLSTDADQHICLWVRDGWSIDENSVRADSRQAGNQSPTVFVFIPKRSADDLRHQLIDYKAASATLDKRGVPNTPEGTEARAAMETTRQSAEGSPPLAYRCKSVHLLIALGDLRRDGCGPRGFPNDLTYVGSVDQDLFSPIQASFDCHLGSLDALTINRSNCGCCLSGLGLACYDTQPILFQNP